MNGAEAPKTSRVAGVEAANRTVLDDPLTVRSDPTETIPGELTLTGRPESTHSGRLESTLTGH
jgi:hypothetical protein